MKKLILILALLIIAGIAAYWFFSKTAPKKQASIETTSLELQSNSSAFAAKTGQAMRAYLAMKDAFVNFDTAKVKMNASLFIQYLDNIPLEELKKDSVNIFETASSVKNDIKANIESLLTRNNITEMRRDFSMATDQIYPGFLMLINYDGPKLYIQRCPMAFNDSEAANWISDSAVIRNPYLGRFDPKYKSGMLTCGEILDSTGKKPQKK